MWSVARGLAAALDKPADAPGEGGGMVRQIAAELNGASLYVAAAGHGSVLAVLTDRMADPVVVGVEMSQLVTSLDGHLAIAARSSSARN
jgi:hypothetical protein